VNRRGVRRSGIKVGHISEDDVNRIVAGEGIGGGSNSNRGEDAEVERFLQIYLHNLGLSLPPQQLDALRAQIRQMVRERSRGDSDVSDDDDDESI
jgi:hypothetical protein